jgi:hypothetical protein
MMQVARFPLSSRELCWRGDMRLETFVFFPPSFILGAKVLRRCMMGWFFRDKRPAWVQEEERKFIAAANSLKTLHVTPEGGMRIDPEELRDQIIAGRELYKQFVKR